MAYYYFFETSTQNRGGQMKPTLRALPFQSFPDGTPVDPKLNVQAPKSKGESPYGNRLDYPDGTRFCSDHLELVNHREDGTPCEPFYSVYDGTNNFGTNSFPNFHPVSTDANFAYAELMHRSDEMNKQYVLFEAGLGQGTPDDQTGTNDTGTRPARLSPAEDNGHARPFQKDWQERYDHQIENEEGFIKDWLTDYQKEKGINGKIYPANYHNTLVDIFHAGETVNSIVNVQRLEGIINAKGKNIKSISILPGGLYGFYLKAIYEEHQNGAKCTATPRNPNDGRSLQEAANIICETMNVKFGGSSLPSNKTALENLKKALEMGWTLDDCMEPSINEKVKSYPELVKALADGTIPFEKAQILQNGVSRLDMLLTDMKNMKPKDKDGFHIDDITWRSLLFALYEKEPTMLVGPTGTGKTEVIIKLCEQTGTPYTLIQMGGITDPYEQLVLGKDLANNGTETVDNWAEFALAIQHPGVIILDEVNRIPRHGSNTLFSCLDGNRVLDAPTAKDPAKKKIKVHPDCVFFATANIGAQYTDTSQIDEALRNRFGVIMVDYMNRTDEENILRKRTGIAADDAKNIAFVAASIRQMARKGEVAHSMSTRETLRTASMVAFGFSCQEALESSVLPNYDDGYGENDGQSEKAKVKMIISQRFNNTKTV